jgi:hypothetical protein
MLFELKPVLKYDKRGVFRKRYKSGAEACEKLKIDSGNLCRALHKGIQAGGFYWRYDTGEKPPIRITIYEPYLKKVKIYKKILTYVTILSITEASKLTKVPSSTIRKHLRGDPIANSDFTFEEIKQKEKV